MRWMMILFLAAALLVFSVRQPPAVSAQAASSAPEPTATPGTVALPQPAARLSPIVGILVLLAPAAFVIYRKSRPNADKQVEAACCAPIVDKE